jgi:hypothetical protein
MKCIYIDADSCIREASKGHVVHLKDNLYLISAETASQQKLIPVNICSTAPFWIIGYTEPKPIQNAENLDLSFGWNNFFAKFSDNAHEFKDFNPRDE